MKKVRSMLVAALVCAVVLSFAACGDKSGGGAVDPADIKGEEVTAAQWASAFAMDGVTNVTVKGVETYKEGDDSFESTIIAEYDGDKLHRTLSRKATEDGETEEETDEYYEAKEGGKYYRYEYDGESKKWGREEMEFVDGWGIQDDIVSEIDDFADMYEDFTYDADKKGYVSTETDTEGVKEYTVTVLVKITGGKLAYVEMTEGGEDASGMFGLQFYNYGTTQITVPTDYEDAQM